MTESRPHAERERRTDEADCKVFVKDVLKVFQTSRGEVVALEKVPHEADQGNCQPCQSIETGIFVSDDGRFAVNLAIPLNPANPLTPLNPS